MQRAKLGEACLVAEGHQGQGEPRDHQRDSEGDHAGPQHGPDVLAAKGFLHRLHVGRKRAAGLRLAGKSEEGSGAVGVT